MNNKKPESPIFIEDVLDEVPKKMFDMLLVRRLKIDATVKIKATNIQKKGIKV